MRGARARRHRQHSFRDSSDVAQRWGEGLEQGESGRRAPKGQLSSGLPHPPGTGEPWGALSAGDHRADTPHGVLRTGLRPGADMCGVAARAAADGLG